MSETPAVVVTVGDTAQDSPAQTPSEKSEQNAHTPENTEPEIHDIIRDEERREAIEKWREEVSTQQEKLHEMSVDILSRLEAVQELQTTTATALEAILSALTESPQQTPPEQQVTQEVPPETVEIPLETPEVIEQVEAPVAQPEVVAPTRRKARLL